MRSERILGVLGMSFNEWHTVSIKDVFELIPGFAFKSKEFSENGIPVIKIKNVKALRLLDREFSYIDPKYLETKSRFTTKKGDLLISMTGNRIEGSMSSWVGKVCRINSDKKYLVNQRVGILRLSNEIYSDKFFLYLLGSEEIQKKLISIATSSGGQANISPDQIKSLEFSVPYFEVQNAIADILSTLDEKIEVNNQINKTLENMAQAIFKQWFVDFEFPNEEGEPYKSSGGEMFESELGMIPKGWEVKKSSDIANVNIGKTPPRKEKECFTLDPDDYKWISIKDLGNSGAYIFDSSEYLTKESIEKYNVKVVPDNTVVLSFKLTIGRVSITCGQMTTNEAIAHFNLSNKSKITTEYLYLYLKGFDYGKLGNTSSIANAVNSKIIKSMPIIVPDNKTIKTFSEVMESVFSKIKYTIKQSDKLIEIRDSLLPKLMSGEIRVPLDEEGIVS